MTVLYVLAWFACGIAGSGFAFAMMQAEFPDMAKRKARENAGWAVLLSVFGPATLLLGYLASGFGQYGWWVWFKGDQE